MRTTCISSLSLLLVVLLTTLLSCALLAQPPEAVQELTALRTQTSKVWLNEDGSRTANISSIPIHYRDSNGAWQDICTNIGPSAKDGFARSVIKNSFKTHLALRAKGWQAIEFDDIVFSFSADAALSSLGTAEGDTITYTDAWSSTDLIYKVLPTCIKEELILKHQPNITEFRFIVNPGGLKPVTADRGIDFIDSNGVARVRIPGPFMHDANGEFSDAVEATWTTLPDGTIDLVIRPDEEWLSKAVYPVVIDPTIAPYYGAGKDSYYDLSLRTQTGTRYDTSSLLKFGRNTGTQRDYSTCIRWDTSGIESNAVLDDQNPPSIGLRTSGAPATSYNVGIKKITQWPWPSTTLPTRGSTLETISWSQPNGYKYFTSTAVEEMIQDWIWYSDNNKGVEIDETNSSNITLQCYASEGEPPLPPPGGYSDPPIYAPTLTITYEIDDTPPSFTDIIANPDNAEEDDVVTITFTASEELRDDPALTVTVNGHTATHTGTNGLDYTYSYTVLSTDLAGPATIEITGTDCPGNEGTTTDTQALYIIRSLSYSYDSNGNLTATNTNGTSCIYTYDERYRLREVRNRYADNDPIEGALVDYTVDGVGNRTEIWFDDDDENKLTSYGYDAINRLTLIDTVTTFSYDWVGNRTTTGGQEVYDDTDKLISNTNHDYQYLPTGSLEEVDEDYLYEYDSRGLLSTVTEQ